MSSEYWKSSRHTTHLPHIAKNTGEIVKFHLQISTKATIGQDGKNFGALFFFPPVPGSCIIRMKFLETGMRYETSLLKYLL